MEENINDFLGIADSSIQSIKNLNTELDITIDKLAKLGEQADQLNKNLQAAGIKEVTKSMEDLNIVTDKINKTNSERLNIEREIKVEGQKAAKIIMSEVDAWKQVDKVLEQTTISFGELSQQLVDQQYKLDRNKAKQKELRDEIKQANTDLRNGKITREEYTNILDVNNEKIADLTISEARYRAELSKSKSDLKVLVTEQKSAEGSMDQMNARLGYLRDTYRKLSQAERENADVGGVLQSSINELDDALKMLDKQIGNNQRNVGNYEIGSKNLRTQLRELRGELGALTMNYRLVEDKIKTQKTLTQQLASSKGIESDEYKQSVIEVKRLEQEYVNLKNRMVELQGIGGKMQDAFDDTARSLKSMGQDARNVKFVADGAELMVNGFQAVQASMVALGVENEDLLQIFAKMQILQQGINSVMAIANTLQKESLFMLKLREIRDKVRLAYTEALTAQQVKNTAATITSAAATEGLAAAETQATVTSFSLSAAIKSIPGIGWILAIGAALTTLAVILYKVISAEKELTSEELQRQQITKGLNEINQQVNEQTTESITKVKLYVSELGKVKKGSKEWKNIVEGINELTGMNLDTIKASPDEIKKVTSAWIEQYKARAKAEATIQKMVKNELDFQQLSLEVQTANASERKSSIDKLLLTPEQKDMLLEQINLLKSNTTEANRQIANTNVQYYLKIARENVAKINESLENTIDLNKTFTKETKTQNKETKTQSDIESALIELRLTGIEKEIALRESKINSLKKEKYEVVQKAIQEGKSQSEIYEIIKGYDIKIEKERKDSNEKIEKLEFYKNERIKKNNEILVNTLNELEEIRLNNAVISENELTDRLITLEKKRAKDIIDQNNDAKTKELEGLVLFSEEYNSVVNKYNAINDLVLQKSILRQQQIRKDGYSKTVADIKKQIELAKAGVIIQQGGAITPEQESGFAISGIKQQITALDQSATGLDPLSQAYKDYVDQRKLLEADLTLETQKQSELRIEQMRNEKQQQLELTSAIGGAVFAIGDALTQNIKDEKKRVMVEQSLAVAKVLFNQAIAISEAVVAGSKGANAYTIAIQIAAAVGAVVASIAQAQQAISQANASVATASAYAEGTSYHTGRGAIVGEGGQPELVKAGGRSFVVDEPTYFKDFPIGAQVIPFDKLPTDQQADMSETNELLKQIASKQQVNINFGRTTNSQLIKGITRTTILNRRFKA